MNKIIVPARCYDFPVKLEMPQFSSLLDNLEAQGYSRSSFKINVREYAKHHQLYHTPVQLTPDVSGSDDRGNAVAVNTLGRWLFGIPGYQGNARFIGWPAVPYVELPADAPQEVYTMLRGLQPKEMEK